MSPETVVEMRPIGLVRSPYRDKSEMPKGPGTEHRAEGWVELRPELEAGLQDIEGFSHLFILWVFDRSEGYDLVSAVPLDEETPHGVFASRTPRRPNPIGLSVVELLGREGPRLRVRGVDMLDGTPVQFPEAHLGEAIRSQLPTAEVTLCQGRTSLPGLAAYLKRLGLLVTNETGPMHLAAAVGTRVAALFLATARAMDTGPAGRGHIAIEPDLDCHRCPAPCGQPRCQMVIRPEAVADLVLGLTGKVRGSPESRVPELARGAGLCHRN